MKKLLLAFVVVVLAACASAVKVEGDQAVNNRLKISVAEAWNKVSLPDASQPYDVWTQEGLSLDQLRFWAAVQSGQSLVYVLPISALSEQARRALTYRAGMAPDELVNLFELVYASDGSLVTVDKVAPTDFAGEAGVRFEFTVLRKRDGLHLKAVGWVSVRNNELFAASFVAPRLWFFPRLLPMAEHVVRTARILDQP